MPFAGWTARLHHLEVDDAGLHVEPLAGDLACFGADPLIGAVAAGLRERTDAGDELDREAAALALRLLWREVREAEQPR